MKIPTFSRQTDTAQDDRHAVANGSTVAKPSDETTTRFTTAGGAADKKTPYEKARSTHAEANADRDLDTTRENPPVRTAEPVHPADRAPADRAPADRAPADRVPAGPKPRASLMATLGLILAVGGALLVLSGPLLGYGIGVAGLALVLSLIGLRATRRRHVAGKSDALIGIVLSIAAIAVGVLALTGSLSWLGTDLQPVNSLREWLDAQFANRF